MKIRIKTIYALTIVGALFSFGKAYTMENIKEDSIDQSENQNLETKKWNDLQESAIAGLRNNDLHVDYSKETNQLIEIFYDKELSCDEKIKSMHKLLDIGINIHNRHLIRAIAASQPNIFSHILTNGLCDFITRKNIVNGFLELIVGLYQSDAKIKNTVDVMESYLPENIKFFLSQEYKILNTLSNDFEKIKYLIAFNEEIYKIRTIFIATSKSFDQSEQLHVRRALVDYFHRRVYVSIIMEIKIILEKILATEENSVSIQAIFKLLLKYIDLDDGCLALDSPIHPIAVRSEKKLHPLFMWYLQNKTRPEVADFEILFEIMKCKTYQTNDFAGILLQYLRQLPWNIKNDKTTCKKIAVESFLAVMMRDAISHDIKADIMHIACLHSPKFLIDFRDEDTQENLSYEGLNTSIVAYNFPRTINEAHDYIAAKNIGCTLDINQSNNLNRPIKINITSSIIPKIVHKDTVRFIYAGLLSQLHKIGITKSGIGCTIIPLNNQDKSFKITIQPKRIPISYQQIGYEPAQLILQYVGSDICLSSETALQLNSREQVYSESDSDVDDRYR